jgi:hypothetical protein
MWVWMGIGMGVVILGRVKHARALCKIQSSKFEVRLGE